jgi:type VI secretion system protein ImpA
MSKFPFEALTAPISEALPCGPDLELEGDAEFMQFIARAESVLPDSFLAFDRRDVDLPGLLATAGALLKRTADLRLLTLTAKLFALDRDLPGFVACLDAIARCLDERWPHLHPELLGDDPVLRQVALQSLDDNPHTAMPLQMAALFKARRLGEVSLRSYLLADGVIAPRVGEDGQPIEKVPTPGDLAGATADMELADIVKLREQVRALAAAVERLVAIYAERSGRSDGLSLPRLSSVASQLVALVDRLAVEKDPSLVAAADTDAAGDASGDVGRPATNGAVRSMADVGEALRVTRRYFERSEPSSPIRLLLAQAETLIGKSFYDALSAIAPELVGQASIRPSRSLALVLPLDRLAQLLPPPDEEDAAAPDGSDSGSGWGAGGASDADSAAAANGEKADGGEADGGEEALADGEGGASKSLSERSSGAGMGAAGADRGPRFAVGSRQEALALIDQISAHLRQAEPSSPIPFILDHARGIAGRDFVALLRELLPPHLLRIDDQ